jgi:hypothetical protein
MCVDSKPLITVYHSHCNFEQMLNSMLVPSPYKMLHVASSSLNAYSKSLHEAVNHKSYSLEYPKECPFSSVRRPVFCCGAAHLAG